MTIWWAVALVAVLVALDKSFIPGTAILGMGILANLIPAREASGITLALIIIGDWTAIWAYRKNVNWKALRQLLPNVVIGVLLGVIFLGLADDEVTKRTIGVILLVFICWNLATMLRRRMRAKTGSSAPPAGQEGASVDPDEASRPWWRPRPKSIGFGSLAGFTTMVANAGGPVTSMYFLSEGFTVMNFLGTSAWFYLTVNLIKLPFSLGLGMMTSRQLPMIATMIPLIVLTVLLGRWLARRISPQVFSVIVIVLTLVAALELVIG